MHGKYYNIWMEEHKAYEESRAEVFVKRIYVAIQFEFYVSPVLYWDSSKFKSVIDPGSSAAG